MAPLYGQTIGAGEDPVPPVFIQPPKVQPASPGQPLSFTAYVTDNVGIKSVVLYYRFGRVAPYFQLSENRNYLRLDLVLTAEGDYRGEIPSTEMTGNVLEYYIEVSDFSGNKAAQGFAGQPFTMTFVDARVSNNIAGVLQPDTPGKPVLIPMGQSLPLKDSSLAAMSIKGEESDDNKKAAWYEQRWVWVLAGGVVLAAAAGGGGGSSSSTPSGSVTINAPPVQ